MPKVSDDHPELFHYTTSAGLYGIVSTGTLRATHHAFLNDREEFNLFFTKRLPELAHRAVKRAFTNNPTHPLVTNLTSVSGNAEDAARVLTEKLLNVMRDPLREFETPYVTSFCAAGSEAQSRHGLLSQWRGYGKDGGYAIVFDSAGLERLWPKEAEQVKGATVFWGNVDYVHDPTGDTDLQPYSIEHSEKIVGALANWALSQRSDDLEPIFTPVVQLACLMKHWGFKEENEVRFIVTVPHKVMIKALPDEFTLKPLYHFDRDGAPVPYMSLLENVGQSQARLPIRRIIVGPHPDSNQRKVAVETLLNRFGYRAEVEVSEIPYRGR